MEVTKADIDNLHNSLHREIDGLPQKIFDTKIKIKNGEIKEVSFLDVVIQNHERTKKLENEIKDGSILVPLKNADDKESYMKLGDILSTLYTRPSAWFSKTATFGDNIAKIFRLIFEVSLTVYVIYTVLKSVNL